MLKKLARVTKNQTELEREIKQASNVAKLRLKYLTKCSFGFLLKVKAIYYQ